jgi:putative phosphoesterase
MRARRVRVGVLSDTHGLLRPEACDALRDSALIVHAGDVGSPEVLERHRAIAPTTAVRGNNDRGGWARALPLTEVVEAGAVSLYVLHELADLDLDPKAEGFAAVITGHSHQPKAELRDGVLYLNPGSAGPRRFKLPVALARLEIVGTSVSHEIVELLRR